jgi:NADPH:quinone reductase-like Zn-dependent oxidoreductase
MKAMVPTGDTEALVTFDHVDEPRPADNEAVVAVEAYSVNRGETFLLESPAPGGGQARTSPAR